MLQFNCLPPPHTLRALCKSTSSEATFKHAGKVAKYFATAKKCVGKVAKCFATAKKRVGKVAKCFATAKKRVGKVAECFATAKKRVEPVAECFAIIPLPNPPHRGGSRDSILSQQYHNQHTFAQVSNLCLKAVSGFDIPSFRPEHTKRQRSMRSGEICTFDSTSFAQVSDLRQKAAANIQTIKHPNILKKQT